MICIRNWVICTLCSYRKGGRVFLHS